MKKIIYSVLAVFMIAGLCLGGNVASAGPVVIKAVSYFSKNHPLMNPTTLEFYKMINEGLKGQVEIKYVGGPEAVPPREQIEAVRNNMVQMTYLPTAVYKSTIPEVAAMVLVKFKDFVEMRKSPFHNFMVKQHEKIGIRYIGPGIYGRFHMWSKKPVNKLADLKGLKMRSFFLYDRFQKALGITPVIIAVNEIYTALERGVVDGFCFPQAGPRIMGLTKSAKYVISHPFYTNDLTLLMNMETWNKIPKAAQKKIDEITAQQYEPYMTAYAQDLEKREWKALKKAGVKRVVFSDKEAKIFVETAYRVKWEEIGEKVPPDMIKKLKKLTLN